MHLIFIRHGETEANRNEVINGLNDLELNKIGIQQCFSLSDRLYPHLKDLNQKIYIYTSPLKRAKKTSEILNRQLNLNISVSDYLIERDYGSLEGKASKNIDWDHIPDDVESNKEVFLRCHFFLEEIYEAHSNDDILIIVSHAAVIRHFLSIPNIFKEFITLNNCSISVVQYINKKFLINRNLINLHL